MAAELLDALHVEAELIEGSNGIFEVEVDGRIIYDKAQTQQFPEVGEVTSLIKDL